MRLIGQAEHDNAREPGWWVGKDVGKIQIQCDERPVLSTADINYAFVRLATEGLLNDGMRIVPCNAKHLRQHRREVFVEFEFHAALVSTTRSRASSAA